ncbi:hypothetical protein ACWDYK_26090 [Streptomyces anthocyanicus]|uniref:hypothetical protein n=1 Tax=Streptomyces anthocyanicus TaxID=68174 RepID=UPI002F91ACD4|nr:hypothetical protein OHA15_40580 [Streptomyces anthocyanicus]
MDINGAIAEWLTEVLREIGDPSTLFDHAREVAAQAHQLREAQKQLEDAAGGAAWESRDADHYNQAVNSHLELMAHTADVLQTTGQEAQSHADRTWAIVKQVIGIILEILEILAIGMALSWLGGLALDWLWARLVPCMERILSALARFRSALAEFTNFLKVTGRRVGWLGEQVGEGLGKFTENLIIDLLPAQARAYPGFYVSLAVPQLLSGRPVDWKANAWQLAIFFGFDTSLNVIEGVLERSGLGALLKKLVTKDKALHDAAAAETGAGGAVKTLTKQPEATPVPPRPAETSGSRPPSTTPARRSVDADAPPVRPNRAETPLREAPSQPPTRPTSEQVIPPIRKTESTAATVPPPRPQSPRPSRELTDGRAVGRETRTGPAPTEAGAASPAPQRIVAETHEAAASARSRPGSPQEERAGHPLSSSSGSTAPAGPRVPTESRSTESVASPSGALPVRGESVVAGGESRVVESAVSPSGVSAARGESAARGSEAPGAGVGRAAEPVPSRTTASSTAEAPATVKNGANAAKGSDGPVTARDVGTQAPRLTSGEHVVPRAAGERELPSAGPTSVHEVRLPEPRAEPVAVADGSATTSLSRAEEVETILSPRPPSRTDSHGPAPVEGSAARPEPTGSGARDAAPPSRPGTSQPSVGPDVARAETGAPAAQAGGRRSSAPEAAPHAASSGRSARSTEQESRAVSPESQVAEMWDTYKGLTFLEAVPRAFQEGFNVVTGNLMTNAVLQDLTGVRFTPGEWAFELLGGSLATLRHGIYKWSAVGEKWAFRNQPEGGLVINRWLSEIPISWSYYAMYLTAKDAVKNGVFDHPVYTELYPAPPQD